jgi:hypothetical protein
LSDKSINKKNNRSSNSENLHLVIPTISFWGFILGKILKFLGFKIYYRGTYYEDLHDISYDCWLRSTRKFRYFLEAAIRGNSAERVAAIFSLNPGALLIKGRQLILRRFQRDFHFSSLASNANSNGKTAVIFPASKRLRKELDGLLNTNSDHLGIRIVSAIGFAIERLKLIFITSLKAILLIFLLIYWRLSGPSRLTKDIRDSFIWQAGGPGEISLDPGKLSLPLYLKELRQCLRDERVHFSVICPFLNKKNGWKDSHSRSIPPLRYIRPGLSNRVFFREMKDLLKLLVHLPVATIHGDERAELLSLLPHLFLKRAWLSSVSVKAIIVTNACAGAEHALVHAARQMDIPVIMVFYSANVHPILTEEAYYDLVQNEFHEMLSDHFCVWTAEMKKWLEKIGYSAGKVHVAGPQMFAPNMKKREQDLVRPDRVKIAVIEVTPLNKEELVKRGFGRGFYTREYCLHFLTEAIETIHGVFGNEGLVILKMKRLVDFNVFDRGWFEERKKYIEQFNGSVAEWEPDTNPWLVVDEADIIISIPFSSISEAGLAAGKPSAFFDPTHRILPRLGDEVPLLSGSEQLYHWLKGIQKNRERALDQSDPMKFGPSMVAHILERILSTSAGKGMNK